MGLHHWRGGTPDMAQQAWVQAMEADPQNASARFATIWRALSLPTPDGENAPEVLAIAEGLPESAMAVVSGWRHFRKNDWPALAELDEQLAAAKPTDLWFGEAMRLRATWRVMLPADAPDERLGRAREAVAMLDLGTVRHPDPLSYLVRMTAALAAEYPGVLLETVNELTSFLLERVEVTPEHVQALIRTGLAQLLPALVELGKDERVPPGRLEAVMHRVELVLARP